MTPIYVNGIAYDKMILNGKIYDKCMVGDKDYFGGGKKTSLILCYDKASYAIVPINYIIGEGLIDWGDGTTSIINQSNIHVTREHAYANVGYYEITISANFEEFRYAYYDPQGNFRYLTKVKGQFPASMKNISQCFWHCANLQSISVELFANNINAESFYGCFYMCNNLQSIPAELFANNVNAANFNSCFSMCYSLQSIPAELFANNVNAESFSNCFAGGRALKSIPAELFANNVNAWLFDGCFQLSRELAGYAPRLWERTNPRLSGDYCFKECYKLLNYDEIPENWKE